MEGGGRKEEEEEEMEKNVVVEEDNDVVEHEENEVVVEVETCSGEDAKVRLRYLGHLRTPALLITMRRASRQWLYAQWSRCWYDPPNIPRHTTPASPRADKGSPPVRGARHQSHVSKIKTVWRAGEHRWECSPASR